MHTDDPHLTIAKLSALSPAEQAVLDEALTGVTAREIAERLSLSEATVRSHLSSIYVKLGVSGRVALLAHFRGSDAAMPHADAPAPARSTASTVAGWAWGTLAVFEGGYALYLATGALANGGSQTTWLLAIGFGILTVFGTWLARAIIAQPALRLACRCRRSSPVRDPRPLHRAGAALRRARGIRGRYRLDVLAGHAGARLPFPYLRAIRKWQANCTRQVLGRIASEQVTGHSHHREASPSASEWDVT